MEQMIKNDRIAIPQIVAHVGATFKGISKLVDPAQSSAMATGYGELYHDLATRKQLGKLDFDVALLPRPHSMNERLSGRASSQGLFGIVPPSGQPPVSRAIVTPVNMNGARAAVAADPLGVGALASPVTQPQARTNVPNVAIVQPPLTVPALDSASSAAAPPPPSAVIEEPREKPRRAPMLRKGAPVGMFNDSEPVRVTPLVPSVASSGPAPVVVRSPVSRVPPGMSPLVKGRAPSSGSVTIPLSIDSSSAPPPPPPPPPAAAATSSAAAMPAAPTDSQRGPRKGWGSSATVPTVAQVDGNDFPSISPQTGPEPSPLLTTAPPAASAKPRPRKPPGFDTPQKKTLDD